MRLKKLTILCVIFSVLFGCAKTGLKNSFEKINNLGENSIASVLIAENDLSSLSVNYYNKDNSQVDDSIFYKDETGEPFSIVKVSPVGVIPNEMTLDSEITILFSDPVVPLSKLGAPLKNYKHITITPELKGTYRWLGSKLLSFKPEVKFLPVVEYTVKIEKTLEALNGKKLDKDFSFTFISEQLDIEKIYIEDKLDDIPLEQAKKIGISFTYPVDIENIKKYIEIKNGDKKFDFQISRPKDIEDQNFINRSAVLTVKDTFTENSQVEVKLLKGAAPSANAKGRDEDSIRTFTTIKPFKYVKNEKYSYKFERDSIEDSNPIFLTFSHNIDKKSATANISIASKDSINVSASSNIIRVNGLPKVYDRSFEIKISKELKDIYGRKLGEDIILNIKNDPPRPFVSYENGIKYLESGFASQISYNFCNVDSGSISVTKTDNPYAEEKNKNYVDVDLSKVEKNKVIYKLIDLKPYLNKTGKGFVNIYRKFNWTNIWKNYKGEEKVDKIEEDNNLHLQVTDLALTTKFGYNKLIVLVSTLSKGEPVSGADVSIIKKGATIFSKKSDINGFVSFNLTEKEFKTLFTENVFSYYTENFWDKDLLVSVNKDDDKIILAIGNNNFNKYKFGIYNNENTLEYFKENESVLIFTDRDLYKPGEEVTFRVIDYIFKNGKYKPNSNKKWEASLCNYGYDNGENVYGKLNGVTTSSGGCFGSFKIPENIDLGSYYIKFKTDKEYFNCYINIEKFKRAEFLVEVNSTKKSYLSGDKIEATGMASYYSGGNLSSASYSSYWWTTPTRFFPTKDEYKNYTFGVYDIDAKGSFENSIDKKLDANGEAKLSVQTGSIKSGENLFKGGAPYNYNVEFSVTDSSNQQISARESWFVHPADFYLGIKSNDFFVKKGSEIKFNLIALSTNEELYREKVSPSLQLVRKKWIQNQQKAVNSRINSAWIEEEEIEQEFKLESAKSFWSFSVAPKSVGEYVVRVKSKDNSNRDVVTEISFYSTGGEWVLWRTNDPTEIELVANKNEYEIDDVANVLVKSPIKSGKYLMTIEREGIYEEKILELSGSANTISIPIKKEYLPIVYVAFHTYQGRTAAPKNFDDPDLGKPKTFYGLTKLNISKKMISYDVEIVSNKSFYKPQEEAVLEVKVSENGTPVENAEVTFLAVDKGVTALTGYKVPNPIDFFYSEEKFPNYINGGDSRFFLSKPVAYTDKTLVGGDFGKSNYAASNLRTSIRKDFRALAVFEPFLKTDKNGVAKVKVKFPDTLTTYDATAMVVNVNKFGFSTKDIKIQNPISVRTNIPQELRLRDNFNSGVLVTNLTEEKQVLKIEAKSDILKIGSDFEKYVEVKPLETKKIDFQFFAVKSGDANIDFIIQSKVLNEIVRATTVVKIPINSETFSVVGTLNNNHGIEGIIFPKNIWQGYGGLSINLSSSVLSNFGSSIFYLNNYQDLFGYDLVGQIIKATPHLVYGVSLSDYGMKYNVNFITEAISEIEKKQLKDGGFSNYDKQLSADIETTLFVTDFIYQLKKRGFSININEKSLLKYLSTIYNDKNSSLTTKLDILLRQSLMGLNVKLQLANIEENKEKLGLYGYALTSLINYKNGDVKKSSFYKNEIDKYIKQSTLSVDITDLNESIVNVNDVKLLASILRLYANVDNKNQVLQKLVWTLSTKQKSNIYFNAIETSRILWLVKEISSDLQEDKTNLVATVSVDTTELVTEKFKKWGDFKSTQYKFTDKTISALEKDKLLQLKVQAKGVGNLFYNLSINYSLPAELVYARDEGFSVYSEITDMSGKKVSGNLVAGESYKAKVIVSTTQNRTASVVTISVPSGCEILNSNFLTTAQNFNYGGNSSVETTITGKYGDSVKAHSWENLKISYNDIMYDFYQFEKGYKEISFTFRAIHSGKYPTPGATAFCKYDTNIFGRSEGLLWTIK